MSTPQEQTVDLGCCDYVEAARLAGNLSQSTIRRLVASRTFPQPFLVTERRLAFNRADVIAWARAKQQASSSNSQTAAA